METSTVAKPFDFMPQSEKDRRMKRWVVIGDSRRLPVSIRHRKNLYNLRYRQDDLLMVAYSRPWDLGAPKPEVAVLKDDARGMMRNWLERNDIPRASVHVWGQVEPQDYRTLFRVQAIVKRPVSLFVPPWGDDWWDKMK